MNLRNQDVANYKRTSVFNLKNWSFYRSSARRWMKEMKKSKKRKKRT